MRTEKKFINHRYIRLNFSLCCCALRKKGVCDRIEEGGDVEKGKRERENVIV